MTRSAIPSSSASINDSDNTPGLSPVRTTASFLRSVTENRSSPRRAERQTFHPTTRLPANTFRVCDMGRFVVRTLHRSGGINEIDAADRDANRAAAVAQLYDNSVRSQR